MGNQGSSNVRPEQTKVDKRVNMLHGKHKASYNAAVKDLWEFRREHDEEEQWDEFIHKERKIFHELAETVHDVWEERVVAPLQEVAQGCSCGHKQKQSKKKKTSQPKNYKRTLAHPHLAHHRHVHELRKDRGAKAA